MKSSPALKITLPSATNSPTSTSFDSPSPSIDNEKSNNTSTKFSSFFSNPYRQGQGQASGLDTTPLPSPGGSGPNKEFDEKYGIGPSSPLLRQHGHRFDGTTHDQTSGGGGYFGMTSSEKDYMTEMRARLAGIAAGLKVAGGGGGGARRRLILLGTGVVMVMTTMYHLSSGFGDRNFIPSDSRLSLQAEGGVGDSPHWPFPLVESNISASPLVTRHNPPREIDLSSDPLPLSATLEERLRHWEMSPGGRGPGKHLGLDGKYHEEIELGQMTEYGLEACSNVDHQLNNHMIRYSVNVWATMTRESIAYIRAQLIHYMRAEVLAKSLHLNHGEGRGIVMVAGNADTFKRVAWSVRYQRNKGMKLPVQVYHFPEEALPEDHETRRELEELGVELVEAKDQKRDKGKNKSYHLKALAVVDCPWREVLYLDSDNIPIKDPEYMFESPIYKRLGWFSTPDYWKTSPTNPIWSILGIRPRNEWEMEAGAIFLDKKLHLDVMLLTRYMLEEHAFMFYFSDGDKDIFRWALLALRKRWGQPGRWVAAAGLPGATASGDFCGLTMLQFDAWGDELFVHYNLMKQVSSGIGRGFSWGRHKAMPLFNAFPPEAKHAHEKESAVSDLDIHLPGLGDIDCDMLCDADLEGHARAPAREEVRRRAARELGVKARFHGGAISALCIDVDYQDPRPKAVQEVAKAAEEKKKAEMEANDKAWEQLKAQKEQAGEQVPERPIEEESMEGKAVQPDWNPSPIELIWWRDRPALSNFEGELYDLGFVPSGAGF